MDTTEISFSDINAFNDGQRESFEDLICVLARREKPQGGIEYQPNEGRGGDGGVEAIWLLDNGKKVGYQAKFFLSLEDTQWRQMDESVQQALRVHPELQTYVFALPKDLTPNRGGKGKSEWQKWFDRIEKWKKWAAENSISIEFELWSETILKEMLLREGSSPLVRYWFGKDVLNPSWFKEQISSANRMLDDRFNPDDHVGVSIEELFDTIVRGPSIIEKLRAAFNQLETVDIQKTLSLSEKLLPTTEASLKVRSTWQKVTGLKDSLGHDLDKEWDVHSAKNTVDELRSELQNLESDLDSVDEAQFSELNQHKLENVLRGFPDINSACYSLSSFFSQTRLQAEARRCAVIYGPAGAGKSHILGQVAEQRVGVGLPTVLVLGQSLSQSPFWEQIGSLLGLEGRSEESVLGTLNAAGERIGERTLLLFDAINEGVGAGYWRQKLPDIINAITRYPYLAAVFSCRDEYLQYAIPETLSDKLPKFRINGFSTPEELERAAIQYLDAKGIARPNTPWLSPEFSNPLFLKSASEAIHAKGLTEFPRGLRGISSIMAFYLDALSWRIGVDPSSQDDIAASIKRCACQIANKMAVNGCDFVEPEQATIFAEESFRGRTPPEGKTWLRILIEANLFRRDPPPYSDDIDPFDPPSDLIRFAFQRFQDHLMAKTLTEKITKEQAHAAFDKDGPLSFLCYDEDLDQGFQYKYAGLISALSTIYPEKLGLEFVHTLPDWERLWEEAHLLQEGFAESFKWRSPDAFPDSAIDLLNQLDGYHVDTLGVLLEVSMTAEHPFNALFLHTNLKRQAMPERDSQWTNWINFVSREELNQVDRVVSWALSISEGSADVKHMELASIVLAWALSSSFMTLRDRATKALTNLFVVNQDIYTFALEKMYDCDDPYVIERLYAAAFGACCIDQDTKRLQRYSKETYNKVFAARKPPVAILTRDYALGIIELADRKGVLSSDIDLEGCFPPFDSDAPIFGLTEQDIESIADGRGGRDIFYSSSSELGDFGKYSIPGKVGAFISTALDSPAPISAEDLKKQFLEEFIYPSDERAEALDRYESLQRSIGTAVFLQVTSDDSKETVEQDLAFLEESKTRALDHLESLLNETERMRLRSEYFREGKGYEEYDKVDLKQCRLWIAKRAYELGWTSELFPRDCYSSGYSRYDNDSERVGKKYQRIALDEIQARLADNFWALQDWSEELGVYRYSHQDFRRDIEPTILPNEASGIGGADCTNSWIIEPLIQLPRVAESDLKQWPFAEDPTQSVSEKLVRVDSEARRWLLLHEYHSDRQQYDEPHPGEHGIRYEELRFLYCVFLKRGNVEALAEHLTEKQSIDGHYFRPSEFTDGPYLREAYWRNTWQSEKLYQDLPNAPKGCEFLIPVTCYHWESHLDKSLPEGFSQYMPQKWFANELEVDMSDSSPNIWLDKTGQKLIQAHRPSANQIAVVIDENVLNTYCKKFGVEPVWIMIAERNVWPNGSNNESCSRRSEGMVWRENGNWKQTGWNQDTKR